MLVDDSDDDNYFHKREIQKMNPENLVKTHNSGIDALEYLKASKDLTDPQPDLIFLDINMPGMDGWEFLEKYNQLDFELQSKAIIIMLTTSENPEDKVRAQNWKFVYDYITKPLTKKILEVVYEKYFSTTL